MKIALIFIAAALTACTTAPTGQGGKLLTLADAGPKPADAIAIAKAAMLPILKDPESARFQLIRPARPVVTGDSIFHKGGAGWEICVNVNAKNSYGGYTGYRTTYILWNSGRMTGHGFRSVGSTWANERGYRADAIERQLSHAPDDDTRAAYNRAEFMPERKAMLQAWADWLDSCEIDPGSTQR